jgi:hypothetical protein
MHNNDIVDKLAVQVPATSLETATQQKLNVDYFSKCIEGALPSDLKRYYDLGYNYFKIAGNDSVSFLKNFFFLFNDYFKTVIRESNLDLEKQEIIIENLNLILKNTETSFLIFENFLNTLKITKNTFDSNKLFMIITGYAINNIKKNHRS